jgi:hypothetical protein
MYVRGPYFPYAIHIVIFPRYKQNGDTRIIPAAQTVDGSTEQCFCLASVVRDAFAAMTAWCSRSIRAGP